MTFVTFTLQQQQQHHEFILNVKYCVLSDKKLSEVLSVTFALTLCYRFKHLCAFHWMWKHYIVLILYFCGQYSYWNTFWISLTPAISDTLN